MNTYVSLLIDAHIKWLEVVTMTYITVYKTINVLREIFSRFELSVVIVTDNGPPQFTSSEFKKYKTTTT